MWAAYGHAVFFNVGDRLMNVTCPQCNTIYRLPDDRIRAGAKLRCSVCRHIFVLPREEKVELSAQGERALSPEEQKKGEPMIKMVAESMKTSGTGEKEQECSLEHVGEETLSLGDKKARKAAGDLELALDSPEERPSRFEPRREYGRGELRLDDGSSAEEFGGLSMPRKKRSMLPAVSGLLLCVGLVAGCWWMWQNTPYLDGLKRLLSPYLAVDMTAAGPASLVSELELRDVRQFQVKNEKLGDLIVIEGKVKNNFSTPRELIRLEAELYDAGGKLLVSQKQLAGANISSFQLEELDKDELDKVLNNRLDITTSNTNVQPGSEVPFIIVFIAPPAGASDYKVRIAEAAIPEKPGNLSE